MSNYRLCLGDCKYFDFNGEVDAIITDPPYNISRNNNFDTMGRKGIDFGEWDKDFNLTSWIPKMVKLLKKGGGIIIFNAYRNMGVICDALEKEGCEIKDLLRWVKNNPMPRNRDRRYITDYEYAIWAVKKGSKWTFNRPKDKPYLRPEFKTSLTPTKGKIHPTQKHLDLMKQLIEIHTDKGDVIMDPFMGSGSTGIAALQLERHFLGVEIDKGYFEKTQKRFLDYKKEVNNGN